MKTLKFEESLVSKVLSGEKYTTWRLFDDKDIRTGDKIDFVNATTKEVFTRAHVTKVVEKPMAELKDEDFEGHEKYDNSEQMYKTYTDYYHRPVGPETLVKIIWFKLDKTPQ